MEGRQEGGGVPRWQVDWVELPALMKKRFKDNRYAPSSQSFVKRVLANYGLDKEETAEQGFISFYKAATTKEKTSEEDKGDEAYVMGWMYEEGIYLERDGVRAAQYYQISADKGNPMGLNNLARLHDIGFGVEKNMEKSLALCRLAADKGFSTAQYNLGLMYEDGDGVEMDIEKAIELYRLAADQGDPNGQYSLGILYRIGNDVLKQDSAKVLEYFRLAADQGYVDAYMDLGWIYMEGNDVVVPDGHEAIKYYRLLVEETASEEDRALAYFNMGTIFEVGKGGVEVDDKLAADCYQSAAVLKDADATYQLGVLYEEGRGVDVDLNKSAELIQVAATAGCTRAIYHLALLYEDGDGGVKKDELKALNLYWIAAEKGHSDSSLVLSLLYWNEGSKYIPKDLAKAKAFDRSLQAESLFP